MNRFARSLCVVVCLSLASVAFAGGEWTVVASYEIPESASGLAWDGTWLYCGIYGADGGRVYRIDPADGSSTLLFTGPQEDAYGLTFDGTHLWTTDHPGSPSAPAIAMKLDFSGALVDQFDLPDHYMSGIAYDGGDLWVARYFSDPGFIYRVDGAGAIQDSFTAPDDQPWDLTVENGNLWMADYWGDAIYKIDPVSGAMLETHPTEGVDPAGVVWDGQFLWYCDNGVGFGADLLYKVDLSGGGTPAIELPEASHDYQFVTIGDTKIWDLSVSNTGVADLEVTGIDFAGNGDLSSSAVFPVLVAAGATELIPITFAPSAFGPLDETVDVLSTDPVSSSVPVTLTGDGVYPGPTIGLSDTTHNYGAVRATALDQWIFDLTNEGDQALTVNTITIDDPRFTVDDGVALPLVLPTLGTTQVAVWFSPPSAAAYTATISIDSNDPMLNPATIAVAGTGDDSPLPIGTSLWTYTIDAGFDNSPKAMAPIGDINGDGRADVIVCSEDDHIRCFNGNDHGDGAPLWENDFGLGYVFDQKGLQIIPDLDGDGFQDLVVGTAGGQRVIRTLSGKTGAVIWTHDTAEYGDGGWVYQVHAEHDFNNDGVLDVLAATGDDSTDTGPKRIYCLDGVNGLSIWERPIGGPCFAVIGVDDFTGDGVPDAVAGVSNASETQGSAVGINGDDGTIEWTFNTASSSVWALGQLNDITVDGVRDVIIGDFFSGNVYGLDATNGAQRFIQGGLGLVTRVETFDDVNGDGFPDFVFAHSSDFARMVSGRNGAALWTTPTSDNASVVDRIEDVNGDGVNDVVVGTLFTANATYVLDGTDGSVIHTQTYPTPVDAITAIPDETGDGSWEFVAGGRNGLVTAYSGGTMVAAPCPGDTNDSGAVDIDDIVNVVLCFGTDGIDCPEVGISADVDGSGTVDIDDIVLVVIAFGACPGQ